MSLLIEEALAIACQEELKLQATTDAKYLEIGMATKADNEKILAK